MPRAPIRIRPVRPALLGSDWEVAYVRARLEPDVQPADALRRYQPQAFITAHETAQARGIPLSQQLRSAVRAVDQQVSKALVGEARRRGLYGTARGLRMLPRLGEQFQTVDLLEVIEVARPAPSSTARTPGFKTLEALQMEFPDWGEQELLEHWEAEYKPLLARAAAPTSSRRRASRRERIVRLQQDCLLRLLAPVRPRPEVHLQAWLPPNLANRLHVHGVRTLHDLMVRVSRPDWTAGFRGMGAAKARAIEDWLRQHSLMPARQAPRPPLPAPVQEVTAPVERPPALPEPDLAELALAPFMRMPSLNGEQGKHRATSSLLRARNDAEAIQAWLDTLRSPNTQRAYRKEALRFLLWAVLERRLALSSLDVEDALAYLRFLRAIPHDWCCEPQQRTSPHLSAQWRPFDRPQLSERSIAYAAAVLHRLYQWLGKVRYLAGNPFGGLSRDALRVQAIEPQNRYLPKALTDRLLDLLGSDALPAPSERVRARRQLLLALLLDTGLRRHEAAGLTFDRVAYLADPRLDAPGSTRYELRVRGKGGKERNVPVSPRLLRLLREELRLRGLGDTFSEETLRGLPVIERLRAGRTGCLSPESIYLECKAALEVVATHLRAHGASEEAALIARATTHWTRHSFGMALVETAGLPVVQELLGHEDLNTTRTYARISAATRAGALAGAGIGGS